MCVVLSVIIFFLKHFKQIIGWFGYWKIQILFSEKLRLFGFLDFELTCHFDNIVWNILVDINLLSKLMLNVMRDLSTKYIKPRKLGISEICYSTRIDFFWCHKKWYKNDGCVLEDLFDRNVLKCTLNGFMGISENYAFFSVMRVEPEIWQTEIWDLRNEIVQNCFNVCFYPKTMFTIL